jgi:hypothetical protein
MLSWVRRGRLFPAKEQALPAWVGGYGSLPFALPPTDGERQVRVFFSGRDASNRSHIGACSLDLDSLSVVAGSLTSEPLLSPGPLGSFDDSGCSVSCVVPWDGRLLLYYSGWTLGRTVPFHLAIGLAVSEDGGHTFQKVSAAPLLGRDPVDPFLCASPSILVESGVWRMWYLSAVRWERTTGGEPRHYYLVKYAESEDGLAWRRDGRVCIDFASPDEYAIGRPHVLREGDGYRMWYCSRGAAYRLGQADSRDGLSWKRRDSELSLSPPAAGWDEAMQAYPTVFRDRRRLVMLYNGNGYGASGFGCATAEEPAP